MTSRSVPPGPPLVLAFAHSDPTAGSGVQADVLTLASLGIHPLTVLTAVVAQDTASVSGVLPIDAEWVDDQARAVLEDVSVAAFKVGALLRAEQVATVAEVLADYDEVPLVLCPACGLPRDETHEDDLFAAIRDLLLPQTTVLVADLETARLVAGETADDDDGAAAAAAAGDEVVEEAPAQLAERLLATGCEAVLLTGVGDAAGERANLLFGEGGLRQSQRCERLDGRFNGSDETLATALAGCLATGDEMGVAVRNARDYLAQTQAAGYRPGMGNIVPDRMFWARGGDEEEGGNVG
jgi:hydroxymethylpyrimidine/phosphomethylpyrimidine kinase